MIKIQKTGDSCSSMHSRARICFSTDCILSWKAGRQLSLPGNISLLMIKAGRRVVTSLTESIVSNREDRVMDGRIFRSGTIALFCLSVSTFWQPFQFIENYAKCRDCPCPVSSSLMLLILFLQSCTLFRGYPRHYGALLGCSSIEECDQCLLS